MSPKIDLKELSIILAAKNLNQGILTPDFLIGSGIIPSDWELARPPVLTNRATQIQFKNGFRIEAQPGTVSFSQMIQSQQLEALQVSIIASRYATALPNLEYQGIGINPHRFVSFGDEANGAHKYITETILSKGDWQNFGTAPMLAGINLVYTLDRCQLRLAINEARLQIADKQPIPAVLFAGNFDYLLTGNSREERLTNLQGILGNWQNDFSAYQSLIDNKFLAKNTEELVPIMPALAV